jgi:hypothetical protein
MAVRPSSPCGGSYRTGTSARAVIAVHQLNRAEDIMAKGNNAQKKEAKKPKQDSSKKAAKEPKKK